MASTSRCSRRWTARRRASWRGSCPAPYSEDPTIDAKVWEILHVANVFEHAAEFDLIHNQADFVPLAFSRSGGNAGGDDDPRLFRQNVLCQPSGPMKTGCIIVAISDADGARTCVTLRQFTMASDQRIFPSNRAAAKTCCSSVVFTRTRVRPKRSRPRAGRPSIGHGRCIVQDQDSMTRASRRQSTIGPWSILVLSAGRPAQRPWFRARITPSD